MLGQNLQLLFEAKQHPPPDVQFPDVPTAKKAETFFQSQQLTLQALVERERGNFESGFERAQQARTLDPDNPWAREILIQYYATEGLRLRAANQTAEEMSQYRKILALDPDAIEGLLELSSRSVDLGRISEAESFLNHAIRLHPDAPALRFTSARISQMKGQTDEARRQLQELLVTYPDFAPARNMLEKN